MSGSRERKREQRRERRQRTAERQAQMSARSEEKNQAVRETLEPLREGERPTAVTVGAAVSALIAMVFTVSAVIAAFGAVEVSGEEPNPIPLAIFAAALWFMTWGMWKARYWAVLGFQMLLVLFMLSAAFGLAAVGSIVQAVGSLILLLGAAALFYFMIRALARIQMPPRPG